VIDRVAGIQGVDNENPRYVRTRYRRDGGTDTVWLFRAGESVVAVGAVLVIISAGD
jgi:hypothetical protein